MSDTDELWGPDLLLLMLSAGEAGSVDENRINGITRLVKLLYLVKEETDVFQHVDSDPLKYEAYHYGPFSREVYESIELLEQTGLVKEERFLDGSSIDLLEDIEVTGSVDTGDEYLERRFHLSEKGVAVSRLLAQKHPEAFEAIDRIKQTYGRLSLSALIRYVYVTYPESAKKSLIANRVLGRSR